MTPEELLSLLGKSILSEHSNCVLSQIEEDAAPEDLAPAGVKYYVYFETGLEIICRGAEQLVSQINFYGPHYTENFTVYKGCLPGNVCFGDNAKLVIEKFGDDYSEKFVQKPESEVRWYLQYGFLRQNQVVQFVFDTNNRLFCVRMLANPRPSYE